MSTIQTTALSAEMQLILQRVAQGERIVIEQDGQPIAELNPVHSGTNEQRPYGPATGQFHVPDDFDSPLPESVLQDFEAT